MDITDFNIKCANFLGWKSAFAHEADRYGYIQTIDGFLTPFYNTGDPQLIEMNDDLNIHSISELKFHYDWNWIHEVMVKIYTILQPSDSLKHDFIQLLGRSNKEALIKEIYRFIDIKNI